MINIIFLISLSTLDSGGGASTGRQLNASSSPDGDPESPGKKKNGDDKETNLSKVRRASSALLSIHKIVVQEEKEPICVIVFKWTLILAGTAMLGKLKPGFR